MPENTRPEKPVPQGEFGGIPYQDLYLVRVQNSFSSDTLENGMLTLNRNGSGRADSMNTFHFTMNAIVENHVMGKQFNSAECVVIAPMMRTVREGNNIPNGFLPADTYFEADPKGKMHIPGARLLAPEGMQVPADLESITQRYKRGSTPEETMINRDAAVKKSFDELKAPLFKVGYDDWSNNPNNDGMNKYHKFAEDMAPGREHDIGRHMNGSSDHWGRLVSSSKSYLKDYSAGKRLNADDSGLETSLYDKIKAAPDVMKNFIAERKANNADPKAIAFYERQLEETTRELEKARPIRAQDLRTWRAEDRAERAANQAAKIQPPPLPVMTPPPLPVSQATPPPLPNQNVSGENQPSALSHFKPSLKGGVTGAVLAVGAGVAAAAEPNATRQHVMDSMVDSSLPGWMSARKGEHCKAFGESAGSAISGVATVAATVPIVTAATGATLASGPAAPVVGVLAATGATAAVAAVAVATNAAATPAAEAACNIAVQVYTAARNKLGL